MNDEIKLIKPLHPEKNATDLELVKELYDYLQEHLKLTPKKAFTIIYYLQEHLPIIPEHIEQCWSCKELFDTWSSGLYWETKGRHYCSGYDYLVPINYDRGKK